MIVVFITILIFVLVLKKDGNNTSSPISSTNQIIPNDYFINATYFSNEFETIRLISDEYDIKKIKNMSIDGKITNPTNRILLKNMANIIFITLLIIYLNNHYYQKEEEFLME